MAPCVYLPFRFGVHAHALLVLMHLLDRLEGNTLFIEPFGRAVMHVHDGASVLVRLHVDPVAGHSTVTIHGDLDHDMLDVLSDLALPFEEGDPIDSRAPDPIHSGFGVLTRVFARVSAWFYPQINGPAFPAVP